VQPELRESSASARETPKPATGEAPNAGLWANDWVRVFAAAAAAGVFLALTGAMNTFELPLPTRLGYWLPLMIAGGFVGNALGWLVRRVVGPSVNSWVIGAVLSVAVAVPITGIVWAYSSFFLGDAMRLPDLVTLFWPVLVISIAMTALMIVVNQPGRVTHAPPAGAPAPSVRFMERLPAKLKGAVIYAVSAEDHYLRLHTSKGSDLILMRLSDAIAELDGLEGAQTHRSWWVAREAVESARRDGDKMALTLKGGAEAPVSRPNVKPLRDAGWY